MRFPKLLIIAASVAMTLGCRSTSLTHRSTSPTRVPPAASESQPSKDLAAPAAEQSSDHDDAEIQLVSAPDTAPVEASLSPRPSQLTVSAAIETGLAQNPDLIALRQTEGVGVAALGLAQTYPFNPFVQVQATPYQVNPQGGPGTTYHYVLLMQQIQLGHQQRFREEAGCAALNSIRWNVLQAELVNVAMTERLYFTALYQKGLRDLANLYAENNRQLLEILERQFAAGQATGADVAIVRLDAQSTRQQQRVADANYQTALLDLKRHLGMSAEVELALDADILSWNWLPVEVIQVGEVATNRPDVLAARADMDTARANTNWANGARIPDLQIGPYYQRTDTGITYLGFRGQMDIPVINNGVPLLRQRQAELVQRATVAQQLAYRATLEAQAAADRYQRALTVYQGAVAAPAQVPVELQKLEEQFKANEVDILRVMQSRTSVLQNQRANLDAANELLQSAVQVTATSGLPLESLVTFPAPAAPANIVE